MSWEREGGGIKCQVRNIERARGKKIESSLYPWLLSIWSLAFATDVSGVSAVAG